MLLAKPLRESLRRGLTQGLLDFDPGLVRGCAMWIEADGPNTLNGTTISEFYDRSGSGNHASQGTAIRQAEKTLDCANGEPCATFDGTDDFYTAPSIQLPGDFTLMVVAKVLSKARRLISKDNVGSRDYALRVDTATGAPEVAFFNGANLYVAEATTNITAGTPVRRMITGMHAGTDLKIFIDGTLETTVPDLPTTGNATAVPTEIGRLGTGVEYLDGFLTAAMIFKLALQPLEQNYLQQGFGQKYGITVTDS